MNMKISIIVSSLLMGATFALASQSSEPAEARVMAAVASQNPEVAIEVLPTLKTLRDTSPKIYFKSVKQIGEILDEAKTPEATNALKRLFVDVFEIAIPTNSYLAAAEYIMRQQRAALYLFAHEYITSDKESLLRVARFLGEIRNLRIPNYRDKSTSRPGLMILMDAGVNEPDELTDPERIAAYEEAVRQNEIELGMARFQIELMSSDRGLTSYLLFRCRSERWKLYENVPLMEEIFALSGISEEEFLEEAPYYRSIKAKQKIHQP